MLTTRQRVEAAILRIPDFCTYDDNGQPWFDAVVTRQRWGMKTITTRLHTYTQEVLTRSGASADVVLVPSWTGVVFAHGLTTLHAEDRRTLELFVPHRHVWCLNGVLDPYWWGLTVLVWHEVAHVLTLQEDGPVHGREWRRALCDIARQETGVPVTFGARRDAGIVDQLRQAGTPPPLWGAA